MKKIHHFLSYLKYWLFTVTVYFYTAKAFAETPDVATMLQHFSTTVPNLMRLVTATAYVMGMHLIVRGVIELKHFGESRTMMSREHSLKGPLLTLTAGTMMLYLPSSMQMGLTTFWAEPNPIAYMNETDQTLPAFYHGCSLIISLIGTIAFIRGLILMTHMGERGQPGTFGRCMTYLIAGTICVNFYQFLQTVFATLGISMIE